MKRPKRLSATFVNTVNIPGRYGDGRGGHGLSLLVKPASTGGFSKSWAQRIRLDGKAANVGLGAYPVVTLARARQKALANARTASEGRDPRDRASRAPTFEHAVETVIGIHAENWKDGGKSAAQWRASLRDYAVPKIGRKRVDRISTADVMEVLLPIWSTKRETARRVRQRIGAVMKWAVAQGYREDNPAGDAISAALPKNSARRQHQKALPHSGVAEGLARVRASEGAPGDGARVRILGADRLPLGRGTGRAVGRGGRRRGHLDGSAGTHEGEARAPRAARRSGGGRPRRGERARRQERPRVPIADRPRAQ